MKVGIIGSGGREHAICHALNDTKKIKQMYCFPGNAGTAKIAENISLNLENFNELKDFILLNTIDLIIVGPEKPLVDGIVDFLEKHNIDWKKINSKKYLPDSVFYNRSNKTIYVIEKKYQAGAGSVDEKLQTCNFKKTVYKKIDFEIKLLTFVLEIRINKIKAVNVNTILVELKILKKTANIFR